VGVEADFVTDEDWFVKHHPVYGYGDTASSRAADCSVSPGKIHLGHYPASENVARWVGIRGHGDRADQGFAFRPLSWMRHNGLALLNRFLA
jgi:hypothetical protein